MLKQKEAAVRLGVNIDHIATLREVRRVTYPAPVQALPILKACGVHQVTLHLREDRRHIQDADLQEVLRAELLPVNLEMSVSPEIVALACNAKPAMVTLVPEKRQELTTEGGLDCVQHFKKVSEAVTSLQQAGIRVSLFIDAQDEPVLAAHETGAHAIELHTGAYANWLEQFYVRLGHYDFLNNSESATDVRAEWGRLKNASQLASHKGLSVYAGHGLHVNNLLPLVSISEITEYNIGHAIIARAVFVGLKEAVREIQDVLQKTLHS